MKNLLVCALALLLPVLFPGLGAAQESYPSRQVKVVIGWPPGNVPDAQARTLARRLSEDMGQPFVVDNRPGAAATIGAEFVARSAPDGYTLLLGGPELLLSPLLNPKLPYQRKDFALVMEIGGSDFVLLAHSSLNVATVKEFVALAKSKPGQISYASVGNGSIHHLAMEEFQFLTGIKLLHVPYKGASQTVPAFLANEVSAMFAAIGSSATNVAANSGKARFLALAATKRSEFAPDVPTTEELGIGRMDFSLGSSIYVPVATPASVVKQLASGLAKAIVHPDVTKGLKAIGATASGKSGEEVASRERAQIAAFSRLIKAAGITMEQ